MSTTRTITVAIDRRCALGGEPLIWGAAEGGDASAHVAARADAARDLAQTDPHTADTAAARAAGLDVVAIEWSGDLPDGQNRAAIAAALAVR